MAEPTDGRLRWLAALGLVAGETTLADLMQRLDDTPVTIVLGETATTLPAQTTTLTAVNLLARLFRRLVLVVPPEARIAPGLPFLDSGALLGPALRAFAHRVCRRVSVELRPEAAAGAVLHIGDATGAPGPQQVWCVGQGWRARVARRPADLVPVADGNPVGPLLAAALGVAELFKVVFADVLTRVIPADDVEFSALTYQVGAGAVDEPPLRAVGWLDTTLVGAGSIGSALLWGLTHLRQAHGRLMVVDHDALAPHNPDRAILVLDDAADRGLAKATWAQDLIRPWLPDVRVEAFTGTMRDYVDTLAPNYTLPLVISAVDSIISRRDIQDTLPGRVLNAATGPTKVEVSRHGALGAGPCLYCLYLPTVLERSPIQIAMEQTGFSQKDTAEFLLPDGRRLLTAGNVRGIERHNGLQAGRLRRFEGGRLADMLRELGYSQLRLRTGDGDVLVTTAFVSALAGFLLLGELIKESNPDLASFQLAGVYEQELLGIPNAFRYPGTRDRSGYCLCHSRLRQQLYGEKYPARVVRPDAAA